MGVPKYRASSIEQFIRQNMKNRTISFKKVAVHRMPRCPSGEKGDDKLMIG